MTRTEEIRPGQLEELVKQLEAGHEIVLTVENKPVAKLTPTVTTSAPASVPSGDWLPAPLKGHRVLTPNFTHAEIAEEMFGQK